MSKMDLLVKNNVIDKEDAINLDENLSVIFNSIQDIPSENLNDDLVEACFFIHEIFGIKLDELPKNLEASVKELKYYKKRLDENYCDCVGGCNYCLGVDY